MQADQEKAFRDGRKEDSPCGHSPSRDDMARPKSSTHITIDSRKRLEDAAELVAGSDQYAGI